MVTVKVLKEWLKECNDNDAVFIEYTCNDDWYNYYGTIEEIDFDDETIVLKISNQEN